MLCCRYTATHGYTRLHTATQEAEDLGYAAAAAAITTAATPATRDISYLC